MTEHCPRCGYPDKTEPVVLSEIERLIIETLRDIRRSPLSPVSAKQIAEATGYSDAWITENLSNMKSRGIVSLPRGRCSGWVEGDVLRELGIILFSCNHIE
jgi:DNA-binding IscR family transcriptional regulator